MFEKVLLKTCCVIFAVGLYLQGWLQIVKWLLVG